MLNGRFDASSPGTVFFKQAVNGEQQQFVMFRTNTEDRQLSATVPEPISPPGLDGPRQSYLYKQIRDFVSDPWKDVMCPPPGTVFPITSDEQPNNTAVISDSDEDWEGAVGEASHKKRRVSTASRKSDKRVCRRGRRGRGRAQQK